VEYALVFMLFMIMLLGVVDFCRALYAYHFVSNMAREATRWAIVNGQDCAGDGSCNGTSPMNNGPATRANIRSYVTNHTPLGINAANLETTVIWASVNNGPTTCGAPPNAFPGCTVEVTVTYPFDFLYSFVYKGRRRCGAVTANVCLSSTSEMVIAH